MFRAPTPFPSNLGAEERPVRPTLSSALEEALPGTLHPGPKQDWCSFLCPHTSSLPSTLL